MRPEPTVCVRPECMLTLLARTHPTDWLGNSRSTTKCGHEWPPPPPPPPSTSAGACPDGLSAAPGATGAGQQQVNNESQYARWRVETSQGASQHEIYSRLVLDKAEPSGSGVYECEVVSSAAAPADNELAGLQLEAGGAYQRLGQTPTSSAPGDKLRRLFGLLVNGK